MVKLTEKERKFLMKDEKEAAKRYHRLGLHSLGQDEAKHFRFLKGLKGKRQ
jgi:hypothetical protein